MQSWPPATAATSTTLFRETTQMRRMNLSVVNALWSTAAELGAQVVDDDHHNIPRSGVRGRWSHAGLVI